MVFAFSVQGMGWEPCAAPAAAVSLGRDPRAWCIYRALWAPQGWKELF